ncbi:C1 family peptidase [Aureispira anguillae]|uniref:Aminopeptidase n=1 Tax=Aureispira anguillae TaxID=2864201 RepID=A0A916DTR9_9BACT|nr:C1 family peptidase [Aureispira anguillae]BDS13494.1 C1 family peptidase [Aureispira anguillae]
MYKSIALTLIMAVASFSGKAQDTEKITNKEGSQYQFTILKDMEATPVQSQGRTGTCWTFSALSFLESELLRMGKGKHELSEMWIARNAYHDKAINYVRMHGSFNFSAGGAFHDIPHVIKKYGIVPLEAYEGLNYGSKIHNHSEMDAMLKAMVDVVVKSPQNRVLTPVWTDAVDGVLDAYLGKKPEEFEVDGKKYNGKSYAKELGLDMDDYVVLGSFTHHPFYEQFVLAVPDNWAFGQVYNLPIDELMEVAESALMKGYTWAWAADVSEKGFSFRDGLAIVPEDESTIRKRGRDNKHFSDAGAEKISDAFNQPVPEKKITQEMRQAAYDNYQTTDDHGMHATGIVKDQNGTKYFVIKNSWGTGNHCDGYFYASEAYFRYKTMNMMVHKSALPKKIAKKLGIK